MVPPFTCLCNKPLCCSDLLSATSSPWSSSLHLGSQAGEKENPLWAFLWKLCRACQLGQPRLQGTKPNTARLLRNFMHHNFFYFWSKATWTSLLCSQHHKGLLSTDEASHCILSQEPQTLPHVSCTTGCSSSCPVLLLASLPPLPSLSSFMLITGQGRSQQWSQSHQMRSNTLTLRRRQAREAASRCCSEASNFPPFPQTYSKNLPEFSTKETNMEATRLIRVNMSEWWPDHCRYLQFRGYLTTLYINTFQDVM